MATSVYGKFNKRWGRQKIQRFIDNLKIGQKFMLIGLLALCMVALPTLLIADRDLAGSVAVFKLSSRRAIVKG